MSLRLGLDTGGTCTDAVLVDAAGGIVASAKAPTVHRALIVGLREAARAVLAAAVSRSTDRPSGATIAEVAGSVSLVSLSTTLATNALVEGRGRPAGLVLIGARPSALARPELVRALGADPVALVTGGHDAVGDEAAALDDAALTAFARAHADAVEAWAVSAVFAVRNPAHELSAAALLHGLTGLPVTAGHELATELDAPRRALNAYLNARLVPSIAALVDAAHGLQRELGIDAPLTVVRGDGSLVSAALARARPIETILSGPAASVVGASALAGTSDATVVDTGGTTSDVAQLHGGRPRLASEGARIGGHRTMVRAIEVTTVGVGGDSEIRLAPGGSGRFADRTEHRNGAASGPVSVAGSIVVGPARVVPLSVLVRRHPECLDALRAQLARARPRSTDAVFVVRAGHEPSARLPSTSMQVLRAIGEAPVTLEALAARAGLGSGVGRVVARLEASGLVRRAGVCPTDAAVLLGERPANLSVADEARAPDAAGERNDRATRSAGEAARLGLELLLRGGADAGDAEALARAIEREVALRVALACGADALGTSDPARLAWLGESLVAASTGARSRLSVRARLGVPIVGVGGPAHRYHPAAASLLGTTCTLPPHGGVANAVGAVVGAVRVERRVVVVPVDGGAGLRVLLASGPVRVAALDDATALAGESASAAARDAALAAGAAEPAVTLRRDDTVVERDGRTILIESVSVATAVGRPLEARAAGRSGGKPGFATTR